ncbi:MAG TPA: cupin domain-containing protein [Chloroflexota bacterium]|nr:cupin domain-containing protein [Chloroflexota bacterium]
MTATASKATAQVRVIRAGEGTAQTTQTPGFFRTELVAQPAEEGRSGVWIGTVRTPAGSTSGWHHHGEYDTYILVRRGTARMDYGSGGGESCEAAEGDVIFVPRGAIHREANTGTTENEAVLVRVGSGEPVFNTEGPAV